MIIPKNEQQNTLDVLWALANRLENNCKDAGDKMLVSNAYDLFNRLNFTKARPVWEEREKKKQGERS